MKLNGEMVCICRAVDHEGEVPEGYVTKTRDEAAALTFIPYTPAVTQRAETGS